LDDSDKLARFRPRPSAAIGGPCIATAVIGGSLLALTMHLLLFSKLFLYLAICIAGIVGIFITVLAYRADSGEWRGYLVRVALSTGCALISGIWAGLCYWMLCLLAKLFLQESRLATNCSVDAAFFAGLFLTTSIALITAVGLGRKRH
jgi:hypothetical protein